MAGIPTAIGGERACEDAEAYTGAQEMTGLFRYSTVTITRASQGTGRAGHPLICSPKTGPRNMLESSHERSDNGPEFIALAVRGWLAQHQMATVYIDPGCPWQNGYGERFNGTVRDECLNMLVLQSVAEARVVLAAYRRQYNEERPHSSLGYRTPAEFKRDWIERQS